MVPAQIDDALESLTLSGVDADRNRVRPLYDAAKSDEIRFRSRHAAIGHAVILRAVVAVHALRVVERRHLGSARRRRTVLPTAARGHFVFTGVGVLKQREPELAVATVQVLLAR